MISLALLAQDKGGKAGGGKAKAPPTNLKFFTQENWTTVGRPSMDVFVASLGLATQGGCTYCHVGAGQMAPDDKPQKVTARMMLNMVADINKAFGDGKQHVTCFTCHRGDPHPKMEP